MNQRAWKAQTAIDSAIERRERWARENTCSDCPHYRVPPTGRYGWCVIEEDYVDEAMSCWQCELWRA